MFLIKIFRKSKPIIFVLTINAMQKVTILSNFTELLKFVKVSNGHILYFNNKICYIKIFCLMTSYECLLIVLQVFNLIG